MSLEENKAIVRRFVDEVQSQHNFSAVEELMDPDMIDHYYQMQGLPEPNLDAVEGFERFYSAMLKAFPDAKAVIHIMIAEGDLVATHKTFHVTHRGEFMGIPPTGKEVEIDVIDIFRIAGGKMVEHWGLVNWTSVMQQLGVKPPSREQK